MSSDCDIFRALAFGADPEPGRADAHRLECAACARWIGGLQRREEALASLARLSAPSELEGGVVQALEAGFRQDRAVRALSGLGRIDSPAELDSALDLDLARAERPWSQGSEPSQPLPPVRRLAAPASLDELVAEELADPAGHRARRYVGSLSRLAAPVELAERLAREGWQAPPRRSPLPLVLSGLGLVAVVAIFMLRGADAPRSAPYDFVVEVVDSPAQLAGFGAGLLDGVSGGLLSARSL